MIATTGTWRLAIPDEALVADDDHALRSAIGAFMAVTDTCRLWREDCTFVILMEGTGPLGTGAPPGERRRPGAAAAAIVTIVDRRVPDWRARYRWPYRPPVSPPL